MNPEKPKAVLVDMDGTLAFLQGRDPYDEKNVINDQLNTVLYKVLSLLYSQGYRIVIFSGRHESSRVDTSQWLNKHNVPHHDLYLRPNNDNVSSGVKLKTDWYDLDLKYQYDVDLVFDDMYQVCYAFRDRGIHAWQVNTDPFARNGSPMQYV